MWRVAGQSVIGTSHIKSAFPCQDHCEKAEIGRRKILALADGAGSARLADQGAKLAVNSIISSTIEYQGPLDQIDEKLAMKWLAAVRASIAAAAEASQSSIDDYATTLLLAIFDGESAYFWQLGDGAWIVDTGQNVESATWPVMGQYVNETTFVTSKNAENEWVQAYYPVAVAAMGFSDGLEHLCLDFVEKKPYLPFVGKIFSALKLSPEVSMIEAEINGLLNSAFLQERTDDDKTLVIGWRGQTTENA